MPKAIIKELDYSSGAIEPDQVEVLELIADEAALAMESDLSDLFLAIEKEIKQASKDANKN